MRKTDSLGTDRVSALLVRFSFPAIVGMVVNALYNVVDRVFIGNAPGLGAHGLAGITIGFPIMIALQSIALMIGVGGATLFSIKLGEGKNEQALEVLGNGFSLLLVGGTIFLLLGQVFLFPLLQLFGASDVILPYSAAYMRVIFFGAIFQVTSMGLNNFLRADGQPKLAMITMFMGAGTNIVLDALFIYGLKMGITGAALATILAQGASMTWILFYFLNRRSQSRIRWKYMRLRPAMVQNILLLGLPSFALQISNSILGVVVNRSLLLHGGDIAVSVMGVINSVQTLILMPIIGLDQGVRTIVSFNFGARRHDRIRETERLAITAATLYALIGWVLTRLFPVQIISIFNREPDLVRFGVTAIRVWFWCLPVVGFQVLGANFFQAIGRPGSAIVLTLARQGFLLVPAILLFSRQWGIDGILYAAPFADGLSALITAISFYFGIRSLAG
ncbi:MATE family efflux transporter [Aminirod propionatiphilus]|uniref:MATE family efflux transporter n=1 Tax=Aminirod propionatiphilus TaxID=3415223 RepID=A0ACD1DZG9_9BACT|nr:MATE family efflux transporter [Synergistota bacterium]